MNIVYFHLVLVTRNYFSLCNEILDKTVSFDLFLLDRNETYIVSSHVDRTIESAASNLASFYEPTDWQVLLQH